MLELEHVRRGLAAFIGCLALTTPALAGKKVICMDDHDDTTSHKDLRFIYNHEGYVRAQGLADEDVLQIGGSLLDCLALVEDGDHLIIVTHGWDQGTKFRWGGMEYSGFGDGPDQGLSPYPVPAGFDRLEDVTVDFCACWSKNDPDGAGVDRPLTEKIVDAMGGTDMGHTASGFTMIAWAGAGYGFAVTGGTATEQEAAKITANDCLCALEPGPDGMLGTDDDVTKSWLENPPTNRPNTGTPQNPNQASAAQAIIDACPGIPAGVQVTFVIPDMVAEGNDAGYHAPEDRAPQEAAGAGEACCECTLDSGCGCGDAQLAVLPGVPALSGGALATLVILLLVVGAGHARSTAAP